MIDGVVCFDLERYELVPAALARAAGRIEDVRAEMRRTDDPVARSGAALLAGFEAWLRSERRRADDRLAALLAIPGLDRLRTWRAAEGRFVLDVDWIDPSLGDRQTYEELVALVLARRIELALTGLDDGATHRPGGPGANRLDREAVDAAVAALAGVADPAVASALLGVLGATRFQQLHLAVVRSADGDGDGEVARVAAGLATLTALFATATRATGAARLSDAFVAAHLGVDPAAVAEVDADLPSSASATVDDVQARLEELSFGVDAAALVTRGVQAGRVLQVLDASGRVLAIVGLAMPVVDLLQHGPGSDEFAESTLAAGLTGAALVLGGPVGVAIGAFATVLSLLFAVDDGTPDAAPLVLSPEARNPGGSHYPTFVDEAGVPAAPNGV